MTDAPAELAEESPKLSAMLPPVAELSQHSSVRHPQPHPPPQLLSPPNYCPKTQGPLLTYSEGAVPFPLLHRSFQTELWGRRTHMRKV